MRVGFFPASPNDGCRFYRLAEPARVLRAAGYEVLEGPKLEALWYDTPSGPRLHGVRKPDLDVVIFQRPAKRELAEAVPHLQRHGVAVVVDVDDDAQTISADNVAFRDWHPRLSPERNWRWIEEACRRADLVAVSTEALAIRYARHGRYAILRNCVPDRYRHVTRSTDGGTPPTVGWTGTPSTHRGDLSVVGAGVARAVDGADARFLAIGSERTLPLLGISAARGTSAAWQPLEDGYPELVATLDVGIAPLAESRFNEAKSWLKPLEYAALGVACVMSPSPEYRALHAQGVGLIARRPREWEGMVRRLLTDSSFRQELAERGRRVVAHWTYERHAEQWWASWQQALCNRRGVPACA